MNKLITQLYFAIGLLCGAGIVSAQSASDVDQAQGANGGAVAGEEQAVLAGDAPAQQDQDSSGQDVAQVEEGEEDEEDSAGRFIPTEQLSQDLGASFPVDI